MSSCEASSRPEPPRNELKLSVVIPAQDEAANIGATVQAVAAALVREGVPYEIIVVNDNSSDATSDVVRAIQDENDHVLLVERRPPPGFGRAVRAGLEAVTGDAVVVYMADQSDDPLDLLAYYRKLAEGYDCVFGSRFIRGSEVHDYPWAKLIVNRIVNKTMQWMFWCPFNDLSNAFKGYRTHVIRECGPYRACHFNLTIEMSLSALVRGYAATQIPIRWYGRTWGSSKLRMRDMGRRYASTLLKIFFDKILIADDLLADRVAHATEKQRPSAVAEQRFRQLESRIAALEQASSVAIRDG